MNRTINLGEEMLELHSSFIVSIFLMKMESSGREEPVDRSLSFRMDMESRIDEDNVSTVCLLSALETTECKGLSSFGVRITLF